MPINYFKDATATISHQTYSIYKTVRPIPRAFINIVDKDETTIITNKKINEFKNESSGWIKISIKINAPPESKGIFSQIANEFAKMDVSIVPIASFSKAHIFVKKTDLNKAKECLDRLGVKY